MAPTKQKFPLADFNGKAGRKNVTEAFALASEVAPKSKGLTMLPEAEVVASLMQEGFITKNRAAFVHPDFIAARKDPEGYGVPPIVAEEKLLDSLTGNSGYGVNYYPLAAAGARTKEKMILVIEDTVTGKSLVLADKSAKPARQTQGGVEFVARGPGAERKVLNFFADNAKWRGVRNLVRAGEVSDIVEKLMQSYCLISDPPKELSETAADNSLLIKESTTIGGLISRSTLNPIHYNRIVGPR